MVKLAFFKEMYNTYVGNNFFLNVFTLIQHSSVVRTLLPQVCSSCDRNILNLSLILIQMVIYIYLFITKFVF